MKHTYKSMLYAAVALAVGSAGYLTSDFWQRSSAGKSVVTQAREEVAGVSPATIEGIKEKIAKEEYHISFDDATKTLQSPNRKQNLRAYYKPGHLAIQNRVDSAGHNFKLRLVNEGIYADGKKLYAAQSEAAATPSENKLLIEHEGFTEEFINTEDGVRQNFIVQSAPGNTSNLQVRLSAKGLQAKNGQENEIRFYRGDANGKFQDFVVYSDLHCWDANKKPLEATLAYVNNHVEINVDVKGAAYPVTIDPIVANGNPNNPNRIIELDQSSAWLGFSVSSAGDVNGDGYSDIIVGAPKYDLNGEDAGVAIVFPGTTAGISLAGKFLNQNKAFSQMGFSVASAGDFNRDGFSDVLVGAPYWSNGQSNEGAAILYPGSANGVSSGNFKVFESDQADAAFGVSVAMAGDVNADGYSDFLVGAHMYDKGQNNEGVAFLYYGANNGPDVSKTEILEANQADAMFGYAIAGAGDVNADGASDIIVGARFYDEGQANEGAAFIYLGSVNSTPVTASQPQKIQVDQQDARLGHTVSTAGDVNGDGYSDIAIGAYMFDNDLSNEGRVYIHLGGQSGVNINATKILEGDQLEAQFGWSIASAGDVNGDGYGDLLVGSRYYDNGQSNEGAVFVYHGSSTGLNITAASMIESNQSDGWLGSAVASAGDVNGDGYSDIVIGCYTYDHGQVDEGQVFVYHGSAGTIGTTPTSVSYSIASGALAGSSVSIIGDYNGDGLDDVLTGAPNFDGGMVEEGAVFLSLGDAQTGTNSILKLESNQTKAKFGTSVAGAGDLNGDGFDEFIVGAPGAVFGQATGVAYIYAGNQQLAFGAGYPLYHGNGNLFGTSVASGDINRDGYDDVIVSAPLYTTGFKVQAGMIAIYQGSANGVNNMNYSIVTGQASEKLGSSLSTADVNGDGFADIIAGASSSFGGEGSVTIWHGSKAGIPTGTVSNTQLKSNLANAAFGVSVSNAGDINGDGYQDIIAGASGFSNGQNNEGIARVYYGSSNGCTAANFTTLEANQADAAFGFSVSGAGDLNGDNYDDVIVGAPYYDGAAANGGGIWVFHGSQTGIKIVSSASFSGSQSEAHFGYAVSGGGDLNGDGYGDVLVGAPHFDQSGITNGGQTWAFFGNDGCVGKNKRNGIRLYNTNLTDRMTAAQANSGAVGVGLYASSFLGKNSGRFVWDYAKAGTSFSFTTYNLNVYPITNSTTSDGGQNSSMSFGNGYELKDLVSKQWAATRLRVRVKHDLTTALTGQVYGPWRILPEYLIYLAGLPAPEITHSPDETEIVSPRSDEHKDVVSIYPNPVANRLFIQFANIDEVKSLQLISASGVTAFKSASPQSEIAVNHLPNGIYILTITSKDGTQTAHRVLIKK